MLTTIDYVPRYEINECLGLVKGSAIRAKHLGKDVMAVFRHIVGGELKEYSEMIEESRTIATARMVAEAERLGADAIVTIRFATANVMQGAAEILVYGTAVKLSRHSGQ